MAGSKLWDRLTRADVLISLGGAFGFGGLMNGAGIQLASRVGWIADQGWAAVVLSGIVVASLLGIMLSALVLAIMAWRSREAAAVSSGPGSAPAPVSFGAPSHGGGDVERRIAALERQLGDAHSLLNEARPLMDGLKRTIGDTPAAVAEKIVPRLKAAMSGAEAALRTEIAEIDEKLRAAIHGNAEAMREDNAGRLDAVWKTWDHAFQQLRIRLDALKRTAAAPAAAASSEVPAPTGPGLYVGRVDVDTNRLESDFLLEFAFVAFNGGPAPLRLAGLRGRTAYAGDIAVPKASPELLRTPAIRDDNTTTFGPFSEFLIVVSQNVERALAEEIGRDLSAGSVIVFLLEGLDVLLAGDGDTERARLPVWGRVTCERRGGRTITGRLAMMSGAVAIRVS